MKILQINNCHYRRGGADAVYLNTINLLRENGHEVIEFSQQSNKNEPTEFENYFVKEFDPLKLSFFKKVILTPRQLYSFEAAKKLKQLITLTKPEIAHIHLFKGVLTASILRVLKKANVPICISLHDYGLICPRNILYDGDDQICEKCIHGLSLNCIVKRCNRKNLLYSVVNYLEYNILNKLFRPAKYFSAIIPVSQFNYQKHSERKKLKSKLLKLYNFAPELEQNKPNPKKGNYFLFYGRLSIEKGIDTLIDAFKEINNTINLKIVGTGPIEEQLQKRLMDEKIHNVEMLGYKKGEELNQLIKNCSFIMVPSEWYENNPMTIVEGFSFGKPVIGSKVGGIPELISEGKTGYIFEMANKAELAQKIEIAANLSIEEYTAMSNNCRLFAENQFSGSIHCKGLLEIYNSAILNNKQNGAK